MKLKLFGHEVGRHYQCRAKNYIIPKRLTLEHNPPVYKWLWWYYAPPYEFPPKKCPKCGNGPKKTWTYTTDLTEEMWCWCDHCGYSPYYPTEGKVVDICSNGFPIFEGEEKHDPLGVFEEGGKYF